MILTNKTALNKIGKPSFLAIITATEFAYQREDGVIILPIGMLKD